MTNCLSSHCWPLESDLSLSEIETFGDLYGNNFCSPNSTPLSLRPLSALLWSDWCKYKRRAANDPSVFTITGKAPASAFSWLKVPTSAFTFKTLLRHYAKPALTPRSLSVKLGQRRNYHKGRAAIRHYANQTACPLWPLRRGPNFTLRDRGVNARLA